MGVGRKAIISTFWQSGLNYIALAVGLVFGIFRDRLLLPDENGIYTYGLAVVDVVFIAAAVSFNIVLIQADEKRKDLYSTAFVLTILLAALMAVITACVGLGMHIMDTLTIKVQSYLVMSGFYILNLFTVLFSAYLEKQLEYKKIARVTLVSVLAFPLVSYGLVKAGWGAWGMVLGQCSTFAVSFVGMLIISKYPIGMRYNRETGKWFLSMGWKLVFSRGMEVLFVRFPALVMEKMLGTSLQGLFGRAQKYWELAPQTVAPAVVTIALPTYAKLQHDPKKLSQAFEMVLFLLMRTLLPFVLVFAILPESFLAVIGPQWTGAANALRLLAVGALLSPIFENMKQLLYALGKPEVIVKARVVQLVVFIPAVYFLVGNFSIEGAAIAITVNFAFGVALVFAYLRKQVSVPWVRTAALPFLWAVIIGGAAYFLPLPEVPGNPILNFLLQAAILVGSFAVLEIATEWRQIRKYIDFIRETMKHKDEPKAEGAA